MLSMEDKAKIAEIVTKEIHSAPTNLRFEDGAIRFDTDFGEAETDRACKALLAAGLQHSVDDDKPEYYKSGSEGAIYVAVRWPFDPDRPTWNE